MKKTALINSEISYSIASLGHTDMLVIADAGLPIPGGIQKIDLALTNGIPSFFDTLKVVLTEMYIEKAIVAEEMLKNNPAMYEQIKTLLEATPIEIVPHADLKERTRAARVIVRTGEFTPFANIILVSGAWGFGS